MSRAKSTQNVSIIDLGDCAKKLIAANHLPENTDLIILKLETLTMDKNGKSVQYMPINRTQNNFLQNTE